MAKNKKDKNFSNILNKDTKTIADFVLISRILGCWKEDAKKCMIELLKRKNEGDTFDFENYINTEYEKRKININISNIEGETQKIKSSIFEMLLSSIAK